MSKARFELESKEIETLFYFTKEMSVLDEELEDLKSLYLELKTHYDKVKQSKSYGVLEFLSNQTKNLINLKMAIISIIKESANIKRIAKEIEIKSKSNEGTADSALLKALVGMLKNNSEDITPIRNIGSNSLEYKDDEDIDNILNERVSKTYSDLTLKDLRKKKLRVVFDEEKNQYILDEENQIVNDIKIRKIKVKFKKNKKTQERYAKDSEGNKFEIIDLNEIL